MLADVARRQRAIDRVGQGMHADIGIGMAIQPLVKRQPHPAQPQMVTDTKAVNVIAGTGSYIHAIAPQDLFGAVEIARKGQFQIALFALDNLDVQTGGPRHFDIIGSRPAMGAVGGDDGAVSKALWRLGPPQTIARQGAADPVTIGPPQRIGDRQGRGHGVGPAKGGDQPRDQRGPDQRTGGIMDHHMGDTAARQRLQRRAN